MKVMTLFVNEISGRSSVTVVGNDERILMQDTKYIRVVDDVVMRDHYTFPSVVKLNDSLFYLLLESAETPFAILGCHGEVPLVLQIPSFIMSTFTPLGLVVHTLFRILLPQGILSSV